MRGITLGVALCWAIGSGGCGSLTPTGPQPLPNPWADAHPPKRTVAKVPNVLLVVWDTTRADRLSMYGHDAPTTPRMESFFRDGLVFNNAVSPSYWTLPSHVSLFTGLPSSSHGAHAGRQWLDDRFVTLAEHLGTNGFDTYAWSSNPNIHPSKNTHQGFQALNHPFGGSAWAEAVEEWSKTLVRPDDYSTSPNPNRWKSVTHHKHGPVANKAFGQWLDGRADKNKPFFGFINYMEAHAYRLPTEESRRAISPDAQRYQKALKTNQSLGRMTNVMYGRWRGWNRNEREALFDVYDASVRDLDKWTGELVDDLARRGVLDDTLVIVTSDHGEQLGEHRLWLHNFSLYETLVHVPLAIRYPAVVKPGRVDFPVSGTSIFATVVDAAGLPWPDQPIEPHSLVSPSPYTVVSDFDVACGHPENRRLDTTIRDWSATYTAVFSESWKYIEASNDLNELFNLATDPKELDNVTLTNSEQTEKMADTLAAWRKGQPKMEASEAVVEAEEKTRLANKDDKIMEELEELGYVNEE